MADNKIQMFNRSLMNKLMLRRDFYDKFPQMAVLKAQESVYTSSRGGCGSCRKTVKLHNLFGTFSSIFLGMSDSDKARLKAYAGVDKLYFNGYNPVKRKTELTVL